MKRKLKIIAITIFVSLIIATPVLAVSQTYLGGTWNYNFYPYSDPMRSYSHYMHSSVCHQTKAGIDGYYAFDIKPGGRAAIATYTKTFTVGATLWAKSDRLPSIPNAACN
jgi:hypothetical protein